MVWNIIYSLNKTVAILFLILSILVMDIRNQGHKEQLLLYLHLSVLLVLIVFKQMLEDFLFQGSQLE